MNQYLWNFWKRERINTQERREPSLDQGSGNTPKFIVQHQAILSLSSFLYLKINLNLQGSKYTIRLIYCLFFLSSFFCLCAHTHTCFTYLLIFSEPHGEVSSITSLFSLNTMNFLRMEILCSIITVESPTRLIKN